MNFMIKGVANWVLGELDLPDVGEIQQKIRNWWNDVIKDLGLSVFFGVEPEGSGSAIHETNSGTSHGHGGAHFAKGLNYVPYDGFRAVLHRGETILNQNQGREWRQSGGASGINPQALYGVVAQAVAAAVENIQINMDGKAVGNAVTQQVSRNIYQQQFSRRFATV